MTVRIINADVMDGLAQLYDESVHCVVTSPPYWGLRDYGNAGQLGREPTLGEHVEAMVRVFREVRRVLRKDGTLWLNYGDSYAGHNAPGWRPGNETKNNGASNKNGVGYVQGLKPKDLCGVPWRIAFALQADGWWLRQDIIWSKPNPMPESIKDRCTKAHEYLFLMAKSERYYFDAEAISEEGSGRCPGNVNYRYDGLAGHETKGGILAQSQIPQLTRNKRSVWEVATQPFPEAHFATFPPALIEPCIKAGTAIGGTVLDPFGGSGTTGLVADRLKRNAILIELNPEYAAMAEKRIKGDCPMFAEIG